MSLPSPGASAPAQPYVQVSRANPAPAVLLAGLATTLVALAGVWALDVYAGENVMGWYANYVLPVGAILVGLVASTGYGVGSYLTGARITGALLVAVALSLVAGYFGAKYLEFRLLFPDGASFADGREAGFLDWFDVMTRAFAWQGKDGSAGEPLGAWGYALRAGEILGFALGGLIAPITLRSVPYCSPCAAYMRRKVVAVVPAGVKPRKVKKKDLAGQAAYREEAHAAFVRGEADMERLFAAAKAGDPAVFAGAVGEAGPLSKKKAAESLSARLHVQVVRCRRCEAGELRVLAVTGHGKQTKAVRHTTAPLERGVAKRLVEAA